MAISVLLLEIILDPAKESMNNAEKFLWNINLIIKNKIG